MALPATGSPGLVPLDEEELELLELELLELELLDEELELLELELELLDEELELLEPFSPPHAYSADAAMITKSSLRIGALRRMTVFLFAPCART